MEQVNDNLSAQELEKTLGARVSEMRTLLAHHDATLVSLHLEYEQEKAASDTKYQHAIQDAKAKLNNNVTATSSSFRSRIETLESQFTSKKNAELSSSNSIKERNNNKISALLKLRSDWSKYIDQLRADFDEEIDQVRKDRTSALQKEWNDLNKRKNQSTLGEKGHVKYDRESPFFYALFHPLSNVPEWLMVIRNILIVITMLWIALLIGLCMRDAYLYHSTTAFFSSNGVRYLFFTITGYFAIAFLFSFIAAIIAVSKNNKQKKAQSESINNRIISEKSEASKRLSHFEKTYKPIYFHDGKWDWDWRRYPLSEDEIEMARSQVVLLGRIYEPSIPSEFANLPKYTLKVNYDAI